jgi:hypothetical protein
MHRLDEGVSDMVGLVILTVLLLIAAAAPRYGFDSRVGAHGRQRRPVDDLRALRRALTRRGAHAAR